MLHFTKCEPNYQKIDILYEKLPTVNYSKDEILLRCVQKDVFFAQSMKKINLATMTKRLFWRTFAYSWPTVRRGDNCSGLNFFKEIG